MIGYRLGLNELNALIEEQSPGWLEQAAKRTKRFRQLGYYREKSSIWGKVKAVYMQLQGGSKCAYCERQLESIPYGKVEQDVEHFWPKAGINAWKVPSFLLRQGIEISAVAAKQKGYYLLAYHPFNYAASCKPCNSGLKKNYFPIAGAHDVTLDAPQKTRKARPYLIFPIGNFDEAPEDLIHFYGVSPQPTAAKGHRRERALVTIEFFKLDDVTERKNLIRERARIIITLYQSLKSLADNSAGRERNEAQRIIESYTSLNSPHTNCARSYERLFRSHPADAKTVYDRALELIESMS